MPTPPRSRKETKYAFYPDATTRAYQERLRRGTNVKFADFLRASVALIASDPELEARVLEACGGGYIPGTFNPADPFVPPQDPARDVVTHDAPPAEEFTFEPEEREESQVDADVEENDEAHDAVTESPADSVVDDSGFWI